MSFKQRAVLDERSCESSAECTVTDELSVKLVPVNGAPVQEPLLCGIEVIAESVADSVARTE